MIKKAKAKAKDKEQSKRFIEKAREIRTGDSGGAFERAFNKIVPPKLPKNPSKNRQSDQNKDQ